MAQAPIPPKFAAQFRKSDGVVVALWRGSAARGLPQGNAEIGIKELTEAEHGMMNIGGLQHRGSNQPSNRIVGGAITLVADSRRVIRFSTTNIQAGVGDAIANVTVTALNPGGNPDPSFNGTLRVPLEEGKVLRMDFVNGVASVPVSSLTSYSRMIDDTDEFKVEAPLLVRVDTVNLS